MMHDKEIFRSYDIRGVFGENLTEETARCSARAFAGHVIEETGIKHPLISVGRDIRFSSIFLFNAVVAGLVEAGADVLDIGECPTPLTYYSMTAAGADGYVMITGSHNPPKFNGLKVGTKHTVYHTDKITRIYNDIIAERYPVPDRKGTVKSFDIISAYKDMMINHFADLKDKLSQLPKKVKVVIDCGSGTASFIAPEIFRELGAEVHTLYCTPDGNFPGHHPDPTVEKNMSEAKELLLKEHADLCVAYDGDADRLGALNEKGEMVWGDELLCIFTDAIADQNQGKKIVADVKASQGLYEFIEKAGMEAIMYLSGHSMIKQKMHETGAVIGGEMSSHFFFSDRYFGFDDGIYASLRLLEAYANGLLSGKFSRVSDMTKNIHKYVNTPEIREPFPDNKKFEVIAKLKHNFMLYESNGKYDIKDINDIDGIRVRFSKGWALVRASNTEPLLVTRFEAETKDELNNIKNIIHAELELVK